jgi:hypothetical protein
MEKIKQFLESDKGKDILTVIIVILVATASFELGRLSKGDIPNGVKVEYQNQEATALAGYQNTANLTPKTLTDTANTTKNFFASTRGKKYYSIGCSAGKTIKEENRIYFQTSSEAEKAGYSKSASCN